MIKNFKNFLAEMSEDFPSKSLYISIYENGVLTCKRQAIGLYFNFAEFGDYNLAVSLALKSGFEKINNFETYKEWVDECINSEFKNDYLNNFITDKTAEIKVEIFESYRIPNNELVG